MNKDEIREFLASFAAKKSRTIVIVDFGNVVKWQDSLRWKVGVRELANVVKHFSSGQLFLRRFYYGADYGPNTNSTTLTPWSSLILRTAQNNGFGVVQKRVKYIHSRTNPHGYEKKCDFDVEITIDLIRERENYDTIVLFSGDGDLVVALQYLWEEYQKSTVVMSARGHISREIMDAKDSEIVEHILFAEDFEYRLSMDR